MSGSSASRSSRPQCCCDPMRKTVATLRVLGVNPHHPRIALAHDWLVGYRGGEGVLDCIARLVLSDYPSPAGAPTLFTLFNDGRPLTPAADDEAGCTGCAHCALTCPFGVIRMVRQDRA